MPSLITLKTISQERGCLTIIEKEVPFTVRRVFYTYKVPAGTVRGRHAHKRNRIAMVAVAGTCEITGFTAAGKSWRYRLSDPAQCLVLDPGDWHQMSFVEPATVLLCLASEEYDPDDYLYEPPVETTP